MTSGRRRLGVRDLLVEAKHVSFVADRLRCGHALGLVAPRELLGHAFINHGFDRKYVFLVPSEGGGRGIILVDHRLADLLGGRK